MNRHIQVQDKFINMKQPQAVRPFVPLLEEDGFYLTLLDDQSDLIYHECIFSYDNHHITYTKIS